MNEIDIIEQLTLAVEQAGVNLAPTYQEYMPLAFAVGNSCGEAGRGFFHRLCRLSDKYRQDEADKLYDHALQHGRGGNSLGTVFHLAQQAGVRLDKNLANLQNLQSPHTHTHPCARKKAGGNTAQTPPEPIGEPTMPPPVEVPVHLPCFPDYQWPRFLQQIIDCGDTSAQKDILLLGAVTVLGATLNRLLSFVYGRKRQYPCLQTFIVAPPVSGKGALTWVRRLAEPIHNSLLETYREKLKAYRREKAQWDTMGKEKAKNDEPEPPCMKMFLISGDNSGAGMMENLMDADGAGLICETEADTVSTAIGADYGHWSETLRRSFDHDRLSYNRRTNHEYRECLKSYLCVLISGTPAQVKPLIPSPENGLFSRQLFYCMPPINEWRNQFDQSGTDYDYVFTVWGEQWKQLLDALTAVVSGINLKLTQEQQDEFNAHFSGVFGRAGLAHGNHMKSAVARIAINVCRIIGIVALMRSLEVLWESGTTDDLVKALMACPGLSPSPHIPQENVKDGVVTQFDLTVSSEDFHAVLALTEPLYLHSCHVLSFLPAGDGLPQQKTPPEAFLDLLPLKFTRTQAVQAGERYGISPGTLDSMLKRMTDKGKLKKGGRGEYSFN